MSAAVGVVLAAGMGTRVGADGNKAYLPLAGRSMVSWSVAAVAAAPSIDRTVLVFRRGERDVAERTIAEELPGTAVEFVEGGDSRHGSESNALRYLSGDIEAGAVDVVAVHDAARPLAGADLVDAAVTVARRHGGAVPALAAPDVLRVDPSGTAKYLAPQLPDGAGVVRVQTPQAFRALPLLQAYRAAERTGFEGTDTSSCVERFTELDIRTFPGAEHNLKVTFPADLDIADRLLRARVRSVPRGR